MIADFGEKAVATGRPAPTVVVAVGQSGTRSNGALESVTEILRSVGDVNVLVLTNLESRFTDRWRHAGIEVLVAQQFWRATRAGGGRHFSRPRQAWRASRTNLLAYRFLRRLRAPLIHFTDFNTFACIGLGAKLAGMTSTIDVRLWMPPLVAFERMGLLLCDRVVTLSDDLALRLKTLRWMPGLAPKILVIPSGVDRDRLEAAGSISAARWRAKLGLDASAVAIGVVGAVSTRKQQVEFMLHTMPAITAAAGWNVYFLGDAYRAQPSYARRFRSSLSDAPLAQRAFHRGFTGEMFGWYRALDLVVVCSTHEGLGRAMIEAVSSGTPVVSFDVCSARDVLDEGCGVVVNAQDFDALAAVLSVLIDDPDRRRRMGEIGARIGRQFDSRLTGQRYRELFASMLRERRSAELHDAVHPAVGRDVALHPLQPRAPVAGEPPLDEGLPQA